VRGRRSGEDSLAVVGGEILKDGNARESVLAWGWKMGASDGREVGKGLVKLDAPKSDSLTVSASENEMATGVE
jgi:hypothetical protein